MDDERLVRDIVNQSQDNPSKVEGHPDSNDRRKGIYGDVDPRLWDWPKYTDSIKQREP
jgi:hypothetical protein